MILKPKKTWAKIIPQYFWGEEDLRYGLRESIKGNELAKTPEFTGDISLTYETMMSSGTQFTGIMQYIKRGEFQQRVNNNPIVDAIDAYDILNLTASFDFVGDKWGLDLMILNATDEDGSCMCRDDACQRRKENCN